MNKLKAWFKAKLQPSPFDSRYDGVRAEFIRFLELSDLIDQDEPDLPKVVNLIGQMQLINFIWQDDLLTPMELACMQGNPWILAALIAHGADIHGTERNKKEVSQRPIHYACMSKKTPLKADCVRMLIQRGADFKAPDSQGETPIRLATVAGSMEVVELLLKAGADADNDIAIWPERGSPLMLACNAPSLENLERVSQLIPGGDDEDRFRELKERVNSEAQQQKLMRILLEHGADVNRIYEDKYEYMSTAARGLHPGRILLLLSFGGDINNARHFENGCILKFMLESSSEESVQLDDFFTTLRLLLAAGARISLASLENSLRPVLEDRPQLATVKGAVLQLLEMYAEAPAPLKILCRLTIRAQVSPDIDAKLKVFPLPDVLKDYLMFRDIVPQPAGDAED